MTPRLSLVLTSLWALTSCQQVPTPSLAPPRYELRVGGRIDGATETVRLTLGELEEVDAVMVSDDGGLLIQTRDWLPLQPERVEPSLRELGLELVSFTAPTVDVYSVRSSGGG